MSAKKFSGDKGIDNRSFYKAHNEWTSKENIYMMIGFGSIIILFVPFIIILISTDHRIQIGRENIFNLSLVCMIFSLSLIEKAKTFLINDQLSFFRLTTALLILSGFTFLYLQILCIQENH